MCNDTPRGGVCKDALRGGAHKDTQRVGCARMHRGAGRARTHRVIPASRSSLRGEADACVSTRLTGANQAPIVVCGVSRSFRAHHIDAALGLDSDGMLQSRALY